MKSKSLGQYNGFEKPLASSKAKLCYSLLLTLFIPLVSYARDSPDHGSVSPSPGSMVSSALHESLKYTDTQVAAAKSYADSNLASVKTVLENEILQTEKTSDSKISDALKQISQLQQQMQEAMSKKIDETVTAKLTDSSSTLVSNAVSNKLAEKSGDTTVLSSAVIDALKVTDDRSALNLDSEGKALPTNKFKIKGLSNYSFDGHHYIMATLSASYDCSSAPTNIIYLPMDGNESSTQAMLLSTAFAFHRTIDVNPDAEVHEVVANVPVESAYAHNCVLNTVNVN